MDGYNYGEIQEVEIFKIPSKNITLIKDDVKDKIIIYTDKTTNMANNPNAEANLIKFKPGQSGNPNGRPRKLFKQMNETLKKKGIEVLTKEQLIDCYGLVFNMNEEDIQDIIKDKTTPAAYKSIIAEMSNKTTRAKAMADYRDYMFGKAMQKVEVETKTIIHEDEFTD